MKRYKRVLLPPEQWWVGRSGGKLLAMMFGHRAEDGNVHVEWEELDETNLPAEFIQCDDGEYTFVFPVGARKIV